MHHLAFATRGRLFRIRARIPRAINHRSPRPLDQFSRTPDNKQGDRGGFFFFNLPERVAGKGRRGRRKRSARQKGYSIMRSRMHAEITRHGISHAHASRLHRRLSTLINIIMWHKAVCCFTIWNYIHFAVCARANKSSRNFYSRRSRVLGSKNERILCEWIIKSTSSKIYSHTFFISDNFIYERSIF